MTLVLRDYASSPPDAGDPPALARLRSLSPDATMDLPQVVATLGLPAPGDQLHAELAPRGYRLLHRLPQLSEVLVERLVMRFGSLPAIMSASATELESVEGIGAATARAVREGLARLVESSIFERYE